MLHFIVK